MKWNYLVCNIFFFQIQIFSSSSGTGHRNGTCLTENECHEKNGIASGGCAQG